MTKLRKAICGDDNKNLDDLKYVTGKNFIYLFASEIQPLLVLLVLGGSKYMYFFSFSEFLHTGDIESMNNLQLKYANKTFSYRFFVTL